MAAIFKLCCIELFGRGTVSEFFFIRKRIKLLGRRNRCWRNSCLIDTILRSKRSTRRLNLNGVRPSCSSKENSGGVQFHIKDKGSIGSDEGDQLLMSWLVHRSRWSTSKPHWTLVSRSYSKLVSWEQGCLPVLNCRWHHRQP